MTTNEANALSNATAALIAATERRIAEAQKIYSPRELGIKPDTRRNGLRIPRSQRHRAIR